MCPSPNPLLLPSKGNNCLEFDVLSPVRVCFKNNLTTFASILEEYIIDIYNCKWHCALDTYHSGFILAPCDFSC